MNKFIPKFIVIYSFFVWGITEILSTVHILRVSSIRLLYMFTVGIFIYWLWTCNKKKCDNGIRKENVKEYFLKLTKERQSLEIFLIVSVVFLAGIMFLLSATIVPNNWDSMTYHLARVANWIQNASVQYYPTNIPRQLYYSGFTEYFILHICLLFKNDQFVNLVQWFGYIISALMIYKIARKMNVRRMTSVFSALLFLMCPLAIAESVTTQVDLMASMWVLIFAYFVLLIGESSHPLWQKENIILVAFCASSVGFSWLTKASVCFMMLPFLLWLFIRCLKNKENLSSILKSTLMALGIIVLLASPGFVRNYKSTGDIFAFEKMAGDLLIKTINPKLLLLNTCKNLTMEMAGKEETDSVWHATMSLAERIGVDIENPEISANQGFAEGRGCTKNYHHDRAGASVLITVAGFSVLFGGIAFGVIHLKKKEMRTRGGYSGYLLTTFFAAGIMFVCIRWQPWGNRLLLPTLPMLCILTGYIVDSLSNNSIKIIIISIILLLMCPDAYESVKKQKSDYADFVWAGEDRFDLYFSNRKDNKDIYKAIIEEIHTMNVGEIGLLLSGDTYEYPLWVALKDKDTELHHVVLEDIGSTRTPDCIIAIHRDIGFEEYLTYGTQVYQCIWNYEDDSNFSILVPCAGT